MKKKELDSWFNLDPDGKYIHYQTWNQEHPVALRFGFTEIAMTKENLEELKKEINEALKHIK